MFYGLCPFSQRFARASFTTTTTANFTNSLRDGSISAVPAMCRRARSATGHITERPQFSSEPGCDGAARPKGKDSFSLGKKTLYIHFLFGGENGFEWELTTHYVNPGFVGNSLEIN